MQYYIHNFDRTTLPIVFVGIVCEIYLIKAMQLLYDHIREPPHGSLLLPGHLDAESGEADYYLFLYLHLAFVFLPVYNNHVLQ